MACCKRGAGPAHAAGLLGLLVPVQEPLRWDGGIMPSMNLDALPGTPRHQALLHAVASYYAADPRVLAVTVFGSLGRGTWDTHSDCDLDVVLADDVALDVVDEVRSLCTALADIGEEPAIILPRNTEEVDVVLCSRLEFSIRYHPLATTSPNIVDSLVLLTGHIDAAAIVAAGRARQPPTPPLDEVLAPLVRALVGVATSLERDQLWLALAGLHAAREGLLVLFQRTHGGIRPYHTFQSQAAPALQTQFGRTVPAFDRRGVETAFAQVLQLVLHDLDEVTCGRVHLPQTHRQVLAVVQDRQAQRVAARAAEQAPADVLPQRE